MRGRWKGGRGRLRGPHSRASEPPCVGAFQSSRRAFTRLRRGPCPPRHLLCPHLNVPWMRSRCGDRDWGTHFFSCPVQAVGWPWSPPRLFLTFAFVCSRPQRRQEEGYYSRLEAERRRQHDEAERRLLAPEEPGLCRPPLPRGYEPAPPPPPQRTASYLQAQALSPDSLYTATFVAYNEEEEEEEEDCGPAGPNSYTGSTGTLFGAHDAYRDLREKPPKSHDADPPTSSGAPENLTFRERQRLFSQGHDVSNKVKASRKLMELENELNTK